MAYKTDEIVAFPEQFIVSTDPDDTLSIQRALASSGAGLTVQLNPKTYNISSTLTLSANQTLRGQGDASVLHMTANTAACVVAGEGVTFDSLKITGTGAGATQYGIANSLPGGTHYPLCRILNVSCDSLGEAGIILDDAISVGPPPLFDTILANVRITNCPTYGLWNFADYTTSSNLQVDSCGEGIRCQTGNQVYTGGSITDCTTGFHLVGGGNDGHGVVSGMEINHNTTNILADNTVINGMPFVGCNIYGIGTNINLTAGCHGLRFQSCAIDVDLWTLAATGTVFDGCLCPGAAANVITNVAGSSTKWINPVDLNGNAPAFVSAATDGSAIGSQVSIPVKRGAAASGGGAFVVTLVPGTDLPNDGVFRVKASALLSHSDAGPHVDTAAQLSAECCIAIKNGVASFTTATAGSTNPMNSNTAAYAAATPQAADAGFTGAGPPTAVFAIPASALVMTVTNPGATNATAQVSLTAVMLNA